MILFKTIHKDYVSTWADYAKTTSFRNGARWNNPNIPVMYTSSNAQNAMLEIANYITSPKMVNQFYRMAVFEFPELRLHTIEPLALPANWFLDPHEQEAKDLGDRYLTDTNCDGIKVPSATINREIATHSINTIRTSVYANVIVNLEHVGMARIKLIDSFTPVYSLSMFK